MVRLSPGAPKSPSSNLGSTFSLRFFSFLFFFFSFFFSCSFHFRYNSFVMFLYIAHNFWLTNFLLRFTCRSPKSFARSCDLRISSCLKEWEIKPPPLLKLPQPPFGHPNESLPAVVTSIKRPSSTWQTKFGLILWIWWKKTEKQSEIEGDDRLWFSTAAPVLLKSMLLWLSGHLIAPLRWPLNEGSTVYFHQFHLLMTWL